MTLTQRIVRLGNRLTGLKRHAFFDDYKRLDQIGAINKGTQIMLSLQYRQLLHARCPLPPLEDVEFRAFSQNGEDGVLLFIFALIGTTNRRAVELCAGTGVECNTANLAIHHGWSCLMVDGNGENIQFGREFYQRSQDTFLSPPCLVSAWITAENVNTLLRSHNFTGEIDLLSLDVDGVDYWIWQALDCVNPRVIVLEYNSVLGPDRSMSVPYRSDFISHHFCYGGASLRAFVKLGAQKGYRLIGCERQGVNAFFMRSGVGEDIFPEVSVEQCFDIVRRINRYEDRYPEVAQYPWVEV